MSKNLSGIRLRVASFSLFVLSMTSLLAVAERVVSAVWQKYMFFGYETVGVITLSIQTGIVFISASLILIGASLWAKKSSEARNATTCARLSTWALLTSCVSVMIYCAVALSPLNSWRP